MMVPWTLVLPLCGLLSLTGAVHLNRDNLRKIQSYLDSGKIVRSRRQVLQNPLPWPGPPSQARVLNVPIPTNIPFFPTTGQTAPADRCPRHQIQMETDGSCQDPLDRGNCGQNEQALLDPQTNRGYCAQRLCPVDRIFLHSTQLCHDPRQMDACPAGRELYYTAYGTPVCTCPDGTIESDDDFDDDVCEVILSKSLQCLYGQVFFFKDFNSPPQCIPDPCGGRNLNRNPNELPFVPSERDGTCYKLGESTGVCPYGQYYALNFLTLRGKCATLEEAGYTVYDDQTLNTLNGIYGSPIPEGGFPAASQGSFGGGFNAGQNTHNAGHRNNHQQLAPSVGGNFNNNNLFNNDHLTNQISTTTFSTGQSTNPGGGFVEQSFPVNTNTNTNINTNRNTNINTNRNTNINTNRNTNINEGHNTAVSGQQTNVHQSSSNNQNINAQSYSISFGGNNGQQKPVSQQQTQNTFGFSANANNGQHFSPASNAQYGNQQNNQQSHISQNQNIVSNPQPSTGYGHQGQNNLQHIHGNNSPQTNFVSNQNAQQSSSPVNSLQQSIEVFGQGSLFSHNHNPTSATGRTSQSYGTNQNNVGVPEPISFEVFGQNHQQQTGGAGLNQNYGATQHNFGHQPISIEAFEQDDQPTSGVGQNNQQYGGNHNIGGNPQPISIEVFGNTHQQTGGVGHSNQQYGGNHNVGGQQPISVEVFGQNSQQAGVVGHNNYGGNHNIGGVQSPISVEVFGADTGFNSPEVFGAEQQQSIEVFGQNYGANIGKSLGLQEQAIEARLAAAWHIHPNGRVEHRSRRSDRSIFDIKSKMSLRSKSNVEHSRKKRNALPHASPSNVFESRLLSCKPGEARDVNAKCRNTVLPAAVPKSRGTRAAPPIPPTPSCGQGMAFNIRRMCVASNNAQNSITAFNLG